MKIYIDGDACPVKDDVVEIVNGQAIEVVIVTSTPHYSNRVWPEFVSTIYVDSGPDAADFAIVKRVEPGDIVITQDYGLASLLLNKKVIIINQNGWLYSFQNIDRLLASRYQNAMIRKKGGRTKGPKPFTEADHATFRACLIEVTKEKS